MAPPTNRDEILANLRRQISEGKPIVGAGAGTYPLSPLTNHPFTTTTTTTNANANDSQESVFPPNPSKPAAAT
jgi:predicted TIM-barrel enzyme